MCRQPEDNTNMIFVYTGGLAFLVTFIISVVVLLLQC